MAARRRESGHEEEHTNHERWMVSYSDMLTVMMGLFIVLYAMGQVDMEKFEALRHSLAAGFGNDSILVGDAGVLDQTDDPAAGEEQGVSPAFSPITPIVPEAGAAPGRSSGPQDELYAAARAEVHRLQAVRDDIAARLAAVGLSSSVELRITERGLVIGLVADDVFFAPASAELTATAQAVLDAIAPTLAGIPDQLSVEGHANVLPVSGRYATNWELSSDRATQVLRHFVERDGLGAGRVMAVGFGDARPVAAGADEASLAMNRRVDVVVLSAVPENVRSLLPAVAGQ